jgi:hypothetical protein
MLMCVALPWVDLYAGQISSLSLLQLLYFVRSRTNMLLEVEAIARLVLQCDVVGARLLEAIACWLMLSSYFDLTRSTLSLIINLIQFQVTLIFLPPYL